MTRSNQTNMCNEALQRLKKLIVILQITTILKTLMVSSGEKSDKLTGKEMEYHKYLRERWLGTRVRIKCPGLGQVGDRLDTMVRLDPYDFDDFDGSRPNQRRSDQFNGKFGRVVDVKPPKEDKDGYDFVVLLDDYVRNANDKEYLKMIREQSAVSSAGFFGKPCKIYRTELPGPDASKNTILRITEGDHKGKLAVFQESVGDWFTVDGGNFKNMELKLFDGSENDGRVHKEPLETQNAIIAVRRTQLVSMYRVGDSGVDRNGNTVKLTRYKGKFEITRKKKKKKKKGLFPCCGVGKSQVVGWGISEGFYTETWNDPMEGDMVNESCPYEITITPPPLDKNDAPRTGKDEKPRTEFKTFSEIDKLFMPILEKDPDNLVRDVDRRACWGLPPK